MTIKKFLAITLAILMTVSLTACGKKDNGGSTGSTSITTVKDATDVLNTVYAKFTENVASLDSETTAEDVANYFLGGYYSEDPTTFVMGGPGKVPTDSAVLTSIGLIPADKLSLVDDAALLQHAMMTNNFAVTTYHVTETNNVEDVASALDAAIKDNRWVCGQPEGYVVMTVGNYVVSVYGINDNVNSLKDAVTSTFADVKVAHTGSFVD